MEYVPTESVKLAVLMNTGEPSLVVAPSSVYPSPNSMVCGLVPFRVMIGEVVSTTFTVRLTWVALLPAVSVES